MRTCYRPLGSASDAVHHSPIVVVPGWPGMHVTGPTPVSHDFDRNRAIIEAWFHARIAEPACSGSAGLRVVPLCEEEHAPLRPEIVDEGIELVGSAVTFQFEWRSHADAQITSGFVPSC